MKIEGVDHDMLMLSHVLRLYGDEQGAWAAHETGRDNAACQYPTSAGELADIISISGLPVLVIDKATPQLTRVATEYAGAGAAVLVQMRCPDLAEEPLWHLVCVGHAGYFATLCLVAESRAPYLGGDVSNFLAGGMLIIPLQCPAWQGSWNTLLPD